jgi:hypothetical protein
VALGAVVAVGTLVAPLVLSRANLTIYVLLGTAAMVTVGVSLLMGYAGQVSLGQGAFYAVGAYTAALMSVHDLPPLIGLLCAPLTAAVVATVVGIPIMRLRGHYLAFATLAIQLILLSVVGQLDVLGGDIGLQGIPRLGIGSVQLSQPRSYAWLTWVAVVLVLVIARNVITSRAGRGLRALASSEVAAESCGVPVARQARGLRARRRLRRTGRRHLRLLPRLRRSELVPRPAVGRVRGDGRHRWARHDLGAGRGGHGHHRSRAGAERPRHATRDAALRVDHVLLRRLRGAAGRGVAVPAERTAPDRRRLGAPCACTIRVPNAERGLGDLAIRVADSSSLGVGSVGSTRRIPH